MNKIAYICNMLGLIFYGVSRAKTDLQSKYIFKFVFEQYHLLNFFISEVYSQRWPKCPRILKQKRVEAATSSYSTTGEFLQYIYYVFVAKNHQKIQSRCLVHEFSIIDIFLNSVLYGCGFLLLLWKGAQNDAHCNCIVPS